MIEVIGVLHVHSIYSDGTGTPDEIAEAAYDAGLSFVGINDHRNLILRERGFGGLRNGVFFLTGTEIEDHRRQNHLLAYGIDRLPSSLDTLEQLEDIREQGGAAIAAHPCEKGGFLPGAASYRWSQGAQEALSGVEVWNYMSSWKRNISPFNFIQRAKNPDRLTSHPDREAIDLWLASGGCAIACPDAHALRPGIGRISFEIFPYRLLFRRLRTHLLLNEYPDWEDVSGTEQSILSSLSEGRLFSSNYLLGDASGFRASREGSSISLELPGAGSVSLYTCEGRTEAGTFAAGPCTISTGTGRVLVSVGKDNGTWIVCGLS
jgi:hypothetical protein